MINKIDSKLTFLKGDECQFSNCQNEPSMCLTDFGPSYCSDSKISNYCPRMCNKDICKCGFDSCSNGGIFLSSSCSCVCPVSQYTGIRCETIMAVTTSTTTSKPSCSMISCLNGGKLNSITCKCECKNKHILSFNSCWGKCRLF